MYRCTRTVYIPESFTEIQENDIINDVTKEINIFRRIYAKIMGYIAWDFDDLRCLPDYPMVLYMKRSTLYRYFSEVELIEPDGSIGKHYMIDEDQEEQNAE